MTSVTEGEIKTLQSDEIEALSAIYGNDWKRENENGNIYSIMVFGEDPARYVNLSITFSPGYPLIEPPLYQISDHVGESVIFMWIDKIKEFLDTNEHQTDLEKESTVDEMTHDLVKLELEYQPSNTSSESDVIPIFHGQPITDRKSTFQAHVAIVVSVDQVKEVTRRLLENRKIASATHNISAYRIYIESRKAFSQDCDDDGETHAGSRLLHLLQILEAQNVLVVVSRWFGGIQLGPDRFKHINNVARDILKEHNLIPEQKDDTSSKNKKKKGK